MSLALVPLCAPLLDRAAGCLVASAAGDALGAGYEFEVTRLPDDPSILAMIGGGLGGFLPGEWTDDTDMAFAVATAAAAGLDLRSDEAHRMILGMWIAWFESNPADVGTTTSMTLGALRNDDPAAARTVADEVLRMYDRGAANGAVMRTGPVGLAHIGDVRSAFDAAASIAALTHADPVAGEAAGLVSAAVAHAVATGVLDLRVGLPCLTDPVRVAWWLDRIEGAEDANPHAFNPNSWVVSCVQAAWSAIVAANAHQGGPETLEAALRLAVMAGNDTDTVAAVAGALAGARHGVSAVPAVWRQMLHGTVRHADGTSSRADARTLVRLAVLAARGGCPDPLGWPGTDDLTGRYAENFLLHEPVITLPLPSEVPGTLTVGSIRSIPKAIEAGATQVVSMCRMGDRQVPESVQHLEVWITDTDDPANDPNLEFVAMDTARFTASALRSGERVHLHCVEGRSRTATVSALVLHELGVPASSCTEQVASVLWWANPAARLASLRDRLLGLG